MNKRQFYKMIKGLNEKGLREIMWEYHKALRDIHETSLKSQGFTDEQIKQVNEGIDKIYLS